MSNQKVLDALNSVKVFEEEFGEDAYLLVYNNEENRKVLNDVGISNEIINKYGDEETFCVLSLAFGEGYANGYENGKFEFITEVIDFKLANDYTVDFFNDGESVVLGLVNPNGYVVSDIKLTEKEVSRLKEVISF